VPQEKQKKKLGGVPTHLLSKKQLKMPSLPLLALLSLLASSALGAAVMPGGPSGAVLDCDAPWIISTFDLNDDNLPLKMAVEDVKRDWAAVLGCRPAIVTGDPPAPVKGSATAPRISTVLIGQSQNRSFLEPVVPDAPKECLTGKEAHCVYITADPYLGGAALVVLGNDARGLIFALYTLSEVVLGRGPFDKWLGIDLDLQYNVSLGGLGLPATFPSPAFETRAFFVNDEDLFGGFANSPTGASVWSASQWNM
jgi:hypothetical protein